ncbi:MAG: thermonuclease family protein [Bacilli bacterium]|nr:thermonuclease family protein [Bacilli bacterium]
MKKKILLILTTAAMLLAGCGGSSKVDCSALSNGSTPVTDSLKFAQADALEGKKFAGDEGTTLDHYGLVHLRSCTDGDTANFTQDGYVDASKSLVTIKTRFLGVNTPESTAKVEPWGKKASLYTKHILEAAEADAVKNNTKNIALITDANVFGERDSAGNRWLAFVWYRPTATSQWKNLNLELVELGYSKNQLFEDSSMCNYRSSFEKAEANAIKCGLKVHGETDKDYDYTATTYEYSLWGVIHHYNEIGITDEGSSGYQLIVTAMVVGMAGDNLYLRDVLIDQEQYEKEGEDAQLAGLYAYAGFNSALCSTLQAASEMYGYDGTGVGLVIRFYCRATTYSNNVQLSDLKTGTTGKTALKIITADNFATQKFSNGTYAKDGLQWSHAYNEKGEDLTFADLTTSTESIAIDTDSISTQNGNEDNLYPDFLAYQYQWVDTEVEIRSVTTAEDDDQDSSGLVDRASNKYWAKFGTDGKSCTIYAKIAVSDGYAYVNLRVDGTLNPYPGPARFWKGASEDYDKETSIFDCESEDSPVGHKFHVTGYLARYFNKYQIQLGNNYNGYNYIVDAD